MCSTWPGQTQPKTWVGGKSAIIDFKKPIKCPKCGKSLLVLQVEVTKVFEWTIDKDDNEDEGEFQDNGQGSTEVFCYNCGEKIGHYDANQEWGLFPDGNVVDYYMR